MPVELVIYYPAKVELVRRKPFKLVQQARGEYMEQVIKDPCGPFAVGLRKL